MFDANLAKHGDKTSFIYEDTSLTYKELDTLCLEFVAVLPKPKQLILVKAATNIETIVGYLGFLRANHAFMMLDAFVDTALIENILDIYKPNLIWEKREKNYEYIYKFESYGLRVYNRDALELYPKLSLMLSTSGTTGSPKMVQLTKENLYANCNSIIEYLGINDQHRAITNLPLYYSYGLSILNTHLEKGASLVVTDSSIMSKEFWETFKEHKVSTLNGVPYNYEIFRRIGLMKMDLPSLKYMTQAGGKLNEKLVKEFSSWAKERGIVFYVMYGQTEATARISYLSPTMTTQKGTSIGVAIANGKLTIRDLNTSKNVEEALINGELIYEGKNVMLGYASSLEDLARGDVLHGVLHTGDVAYKDEDGYFYITGRIKRFIKIHGNRVGLDEIEQFLKQNYSDVLVTGIDNKLMIATLSEECNEEIKNRLIKKYKLHHSVLKVRRVEAFPISSAGKVKYQELIKEFV